MRIMYWRDGIRNVLGEQRVERGVLRVTLLKKYKATHIHDSKIKTATSKSDVNGVKKKRLSSIFFFIRRAVCKNYEFPFGWRDANGWMLRNGEMAITCTLTPHNATTPRQKSCLCIQIPGVVLFSPTVSHIMLYVWIHITCDMCLLCLLF